MDFRLKVFKTVAEKLSFSKAAKEMFISQPAVTKHIRELERYYGKALFNRQGKRISLTPEGQVLKDYAEKIAVLYQELDNELLALDNELSKKIFLGASTTIAQYILPKILAKFKNVYPDSCLMLFNGNTEYIEQLVLDKKISLGLIEGEASNPLLHFEPFLEDEIVLITRAGNNRIKTSSIKRADIKKLPLVMREEGSGTRVVVEQALKAAGVSIENLEIKAILGSTESIKSYLLFSDDYAFVSVHAVSEELISNKLRLIEVEGLSLSRNFYFVNLHGAYSRTLGVLKHFIKSNYNLKE